MDRWIGGQIEKQIDKEKVYTENEQLWKETEYEKEERSRSKKERKKARENKRHGGRIEELERDL